MPLPSYKSLGIRKDSSIFESTLMIHFQRVANKVDAARIDGGAATIGLPCFVGDVVELSHAVGSLRLAEGLGSPAAGVLVPQRHSEVSHAAVVSMNGLVASYCDLRVSFPVHGALVHVCRAHEQVLVIHCMYSDIIRNSVLQRRLGRWREGGRWECLCVRERERETRIQGKKPKNR